MKIILSRKGFDSANGRVASPILPSGELCSLPIPSTPGIRYRELRFRDLSLGEYCRQLTKGRYHGARSAHLDPDLNPETFRRKPGWKPLFGPGGPAQTHLDRHGVGEGDVFLFFGWFRRVKGTPRGLAYEPHAPNLHVIFGWLQVGRVWSAADAVRVPEWARYHPHIDYLASGGKVYVAAKTLQLSANSPSIAGAGIVKGYREELCLTAPGRTRSNWKLPAWFNPRGKSSRLSYHEDLKRWRAGKNCVYLKSVPIGQEFVLDCDDYPESIEWLSEILGASV